MAVARGRARALAVVALLAGLPLTVAEGASGGGAPSCFGKQATIIATDADATFGTGGPDVIVGDAGRNDIYGGNGDDLICGLGRRDVIHGGNGDDRLSGGPGSDAIEGERGRKDEIFGGPGHDTCNQDWLAMTGSGGSGGSKRTRSCELII
jgi:Ca2+-binding RTX toxin-like protein